MEKQWENSSSNNRSSNEGHEDRSFQSIGKESRGDQYEEDGQANNGRSGQSSGEDPHLSNLAYNWVTFVKNKAQAVKAYEQYISDAEKAGANECADLFRKACKADLEQLGQARHHLSAILKENADAETANAE